MNEEVIQFFKVFLAGVLLIGFFYFILIRAINTKNYIRKSFFIFISGSIIFLFLLGGLIYDFSNGLKIENVQLSYFAFLIVAFIYMVFFTIFYFLKGYKYKQTFKSKFTYKTKEDLKPTIRKLVYNIKI